jgi:hypothetical protein
VLVLSSNPSEAFRLGDIVYPCKDGKITVNNEQL